MTRNENEFAAQLRTLAEQLTRCDQVTRHDTEGEKEAWTLAHDFLDLSESFKTFMDKQIPRLYEEGLTSEQLNEILIDIGEEFRHITYHLRNSKFFAYLHETT